MSTQFPCSPPSQQTVTASLWREYHRFNFPLLRAIFSGIPCQISSQQVCQSWVAVHHQHQFHFFRHLYALERLPPLLSSGQYVFELAFLEVRSKLKIGEV